MERALEIITFPPTPGPLHMLCSLPPTFSSVYTHISPFPGLFQVLQEALLVVLALVCGGVYSLGRSCPSCNFALIHLFVYEESWAGKD